MKTNRSKRAKLRSDLKELLSIRQFKTSLSKVKKHCQSVKSKLREDHRKRVKWLASKYRRPPLNQVLPEELQETYSDCTIFKENCDLGPEGAQGVEIVVMAGEEIILLPSELKLLSRGPKYCLMKNCSEEKMCCQLETSPVKHKWDCLSHEQPEGEIPEPELTVEGPRSRRGSRSYQRKWQQRPD